MNLPRMFLRNCRKSMSRSKVADSAGQDLVSGAQLLLRTLIVKRLLERDVLAADEKFVGLLLATVGRRRARQRGAPPDGACAGQPQLHGLQRHHQPLHSRGGHQCMC